MEDERKILAHEIKVRPADVDVEIRLAHVADRVLRQVPAERGDHAREFGHAALAGPAMEMATDANCQGRSFQSTFAGSSTVIRALLLRVRIDRGVT